MNKLLILLSFIFIVFVSCDGRERVNKNNVEVLKEHKLLDSFSEKVEYIPKKFYEKVTDTILSNGFNVRIRFYTNLKSHVSVESNNDIKYYRDFVSKITISKDSKKIFEENIYKYSLNNNNNIQRVEKLIMSSSYINYEKSLDTNKVIITLPLCSTDTGHCLFYELIVDSNGDFEYKLMENNNNFYH